MNREKENKSFQDSLKRFFKVSKTNPGNIPQNRTLTLTDDILNDLSKESPTPVRLRVMKELTAKLLTNQLETYGVEKLWSCIQDIFTEPSQEVRYEAFQFVQSLIKGQFDRIDIMRAQFFRFIKQHENPQDVGQCVDLLCVLTNDGKEVEHFEEEIGPFLHNWIVDVSNVGKLGEYLKILDNIIKFNSPHLDEYIMSGYVRNLCILCCSSNQYQIVQMCLQILGTIVAYSILPPEVLSQFVSTLCRTVTVEPYCQASWKTMKNLLGTHMGHSSLFTMCRFLQEKNIKQDPSLVQGCVFYIHVALWDAHALQNLKCPPSAVLPSILQAVKCELPPVNYEVIHGIQKLINKHGRDLLQPNWDVILEILSRIHQQTVINPEQVQNNGITKLLHEILSSIEELISDGRFNGSYEQFYKVIHECVLERPDGSVIKMINYLAKDIRPIQKNWLTVLYNLLGNYFRPEINTNIRLKLLSILSNTLQLYGSHEDELMDRIVIPHTQNIASDDNITIRAEVGRLLVNWCMDLNSNICKELLEILEKLLFRPFERFPNEIPATAEAEIFDINSIVPGLIQLFAKKIHRLPSSHAIYIHSMFLQFLQKSLEKLTFRNFNQNRIAILECLLKMRSDGACHLGYPDPATDQIKFSSYLTITYKSADSMMGSPPPNSLVISSSSNVATCKISYFHLDTQFKLVLSYLEREKDWDVLKAILEKLPSFLANKPITLSKQSNADLNRLVNILCAMLQNKTLNLPESLNVKVPRLEFQAAVVQVLVNLSSYSSNIDQDHQKLLINTLTKSTGIDPRCSKQSINALTICMVDMRETMMKLLPEVLLRLSKISSSKYIGMPVLEFLSTLSQLPMVYGNFVSDQYMAVFAIALPYTNPFKFDNYVVSLAYHVISVWFLKCRLPFRRDFVKFILSGLRTNVILPFQELFKLNLAQMNQDSSDRKRSSSLTEQSSRRRSKTESSKTNPFVQKTQRDKTLLNFYEELNETCVDLMARYTYSPCSPLPTRFPTAAFLLNGGISKSWMLGNKLITITTSGCAERVLKNGVCDKCWTLCSMVDSTKMATYGRSNSNPDENSAALNRQSSSDLSGSNDKTDSSGTPKLGVENKRESPICACWCQGWAEVYIRRPTGNVSWVMKVQNQISFKHEILEFPLNEIATLYMPSLQGGPLGSSADDDRDEGDRVEESGGGPPISRPISVPGSPAKPILSRQSSKDSDDLEFQYDDGSRSRNPVRRSNSSPEMANWKNPFIHDPDAPEDDQLKKNRVSCEAIPEEISGTGTSPPGGADSEPTTTAATSTNATTTSHPSLLSCHSYPGPQAESTIEPKSCRTVPASPNLPPQTVEFPLTANSSTSTITEKSLERPNNLPNLGNLAPLAGKPPQSPTQTSPRLSRHLSDAGATITSGNSNSKDGGLQKSSSSSKVERGKSSVHLDTTETLAEMRSRGHTISVMSTTKRPIAIEKNRLEESTKKNMSSDEPMKKLDKKGLKSGLNPSFVFLQLYHTASFGNTDEQPLYVNCVGAVARAIKYLDNIYPYEIHKIGILYINKGQVGNEVEILRNTFGSVKYTEFLQKLGTLIRISDVDPTNVFIGGLDPKGSDGANTYIHQDDLVMLAFHVGTLMPNRDNDPQANRKKAHIGNDNVVIVYNDSGEDFDVNIIRSQVTLAYIVVEPLEFNSYKVEVRVKSDLLKIIGSNESILVSEQSVAVLVRQLAIHADLASTVLNSLRSHSTDPYASNWLERLRRLKHLRQKVIEENKDRKKSEMGFSDGKNMVQDFTDFT